MLGPSSSPETTTRASIRRPSRSRRWMGKLLDLWKKTLTSLQARVEPWDFKHWIQPVQCGRQDEVAREIVLAVPDESHGRWLEEHFSAFFHEEVARLGLGEYRNRRTTYHPRD